MERRGFVIGLVTAGIGAGAGCLSIFGDGNGEATTTTVDPETVDFPSHTGTHTITNEDGYWSFTVDVPVTFRLSYTVENRRDTERDFDVFVFTAEEFQTYKTRVDGGGGNPSWIPGLAAQLVRDSASKQQTLSPGTYHVVVDNTDIGGATEFGPESTREVYVEIETGPAT
jgi:hypothetical protein